MGKMRKLRNKLWNELQMKSVTRKPTDTTVCARDISPTVSPPAFSQNIPTVCLVHPADKDNTMQNSLELSKCIKHKYIHLQQKCGKGVKF